MQNRELTTLTSARAEPRDQGEKTSDLRAKTRVGGLVWWWLRNSSADLADLAQAALDAKFPTPFLPLPHPVSSTVAFGRMIRAAEHVIGTERWTGDTIGRARLTERVPVEVREWSTLFDPAAFVGVALPWGATRRLLGRPRRVRLWICLRRDPAAGVLPTMEVVRFFMVVEVASGKTKLLDITDHVVKVATSPQPAQRRAEEEALVAEVLNVLGMKGRPRKLPQEAIRVQGNLLMGQHLFRVLDRERTRATSPEISDGLKAALEEVGGVKLRPGLFVVPGEDGVKRAEAMLAYLKDVRNAEVGMFDLYEEAAQPRLGSIIRPVLEAESERLLQEIDGFEPGGVGVRALRTLWRRLAGQRERLELIAERLGPRGAKPVEPLKERLQEAQVAFEEREHVNLHPAPSAAAGRHLENAYRDISAVTEGGHVSHVNDLKAAGEELGRGQGAVRSLRGKLLLQRLSKLVTATLHVARARTHGNAADASQRVKVLYQALGSAVGYVRRSCKGVPRQPGPRGGGAGKSQRQEKFPEIRRMMDRVEKMQIRTQTGADVRLVNPGNRRSTRPVDVWIDNELKGAIDVDGSFSASPRAQSEAPRVAAALRDFNRSPEAALISYGLETGTCAICGRRLTNPRSVERGIGPVCAGKVGL